MTKMTITINDPKELRGWQKCLAICRAILSLEKSLKKGGTEPNEVVYEDYEVTGATIKIKLK